MKTVKLIIENTTIEYSNLFDLIKDQLNNLGDTDIYEIRDEILPKIIKEIEH